jgi:muramoyltetrapeptide carboxypeptidase LdcA involved in peptidoglycan recycling
MREVFGLEPIEYPTTRKLGASGEERARDLVAAYENPEIKAVFATLGGNDQVTYIKNLPSEPFRQNPKPFFGFSDNTHFANFLWLNGVPSYYGGSILGQFAMQGQMDDLTVEYLKHALFETGTFDLKAADHYNDIGHDWGDPATRFKPRTYEANDRWHWDGVADAQGITWGGCVESVDELLRHGIAIPSLEQFENIILIMETSEEIPSHDYVFRVFRALGERGVLGRIKGVLMGRAKAWDFGNRLKAEEKAAYRAKQYETIIDAVRRYNPTAPIVQNLDFGHTDPQVALPYGLSVQINGSEKKIAASF